MNHDGGPEESTQKWFNFGGPSQFAQIADCDGEWARTTAVAVTRSPALGYVRGPQVIVVTCWAETVERVVAVEVAHQINRAVQFVAGLATPLGTIWAWPHCTSASVLLFVVLSF